MAKSDGIVEFIAINNFGFRLPFFIIYISNFYTHILHVTKACLRKILIIKFYKNVIRKEKV